MNIKKLALALSLTCSAVSALAAFQNVSPGPIVPGELNKNFKLGLQYAESANIPLVVIWASDGCGHCKKLEESVADPNFAAWSKEKGYVMIAEIAGDGDYSSEEAKAAKAFIKDSKVITKTLKNFPFVGVYWPKADGTVLRVAFEGPYSASVPFEKLIQMIEEALTGQSTYVGGGSSGGDKPASGVPAVWETSRTIDGYLHIANDLNAFRGILEVKAGKANKKTGKAKLSATLEDTLGNKIKFPSTVVYPNQGDTFLLKAKTGEQILIRLPAAGGFVAVYEGLFGESIELGGNLADGSMNFFLQGDPTEYTGQAVYAAALPKVVPFTISKGKNLTFEKGKVSTKDGTIEGANPSGLKLTYKPASGKFSGKFNLYTWKNETKLVKKSVKVNGYVINGVGYGWTTLKGLPSYSVQLMR